MDIVLCPISSCTVERIRQQAGSPRFLDIVLSCIERRCKILGIGTREDPTSFEADEYGTNRYAVVARVIDGDTVELSTGERSMVDAVYCINEGTDDAEKRTGRLAAEAWAWVESDEMSITSFQWIRQVLDLEPDSTSTIWTSGRIGRRKLRCCAFEDKGQIIDMYDRTICVRRATG